MLIFKDVEGEKAAQIAAAQLWWELSASGRGDTSVEGGSDFPSMIPSMTTEINVPDFGESRIFAGNFTLLLVTLTSLSGLRTDGNYVAEYSD